MPQKKTSAGNDASQGYSLADVMGKLAALGSDLTTLKQNQGEVMTSIEFMSKRFDEMAKRLEEVKASNDALKKENMSMKGQMTKLQAQINYLEQQNRGQNVEIAGIPETPQEDVGSVALSVLRKIDNSVKASDIDIVYRVGPTTDASAQAQTGQPRRARSILVRFASRAVRNIVYERRKSLKETNLKELHLGFRETTSVFINENLAPATKQLLYKANIERKNYGHRFLWTNNGKILEKKNPDSPAILITTEADLSKLK